MKAECLFLPLEEQHGQDEERTHEADRGGVRLIYIWWRRWESNQFPPFYREKIAIFSLKMWRCYGLKFCT